MGAHDERDEKGELSASLERALLRELASEWDRINAAHFKGAMRRAAVVLSRSTAQLGRWSPGTREIELQRTLVLSQPWGVIVEVLKHEMAHQYAHEVLEAKDETAHGPAFRLTCARLGIDPAAQGMPRAREEDPETARVVERIARLLALAESPERHEAEAAMAAAQRLMLKHNVDARTQGRASRAYEFRHLGEPTGRVEESRRILAGILGRHFFVEVIWIPVYRAREGKRGSVLEVCGTPSNVAMAEYVHAFLVHASERLWEDHKRANALRSNRDRRTFQAGVMSGFASRLDREAKSIASKDARLVWVRDGDLDGYFRRRHPHVRNVRYGGSPRSSAWQDGRAAGEKIVLHRGIAAAAASRGRLLPPSS